MRTRLLPIYLPADEYRRIEELARLEVRETTQQARWLLLQALERQPAVATGSGNTSPSDAA